MQHKQKTQTEKIKAFLILPLVFGVVGIFSVPNHFCGFGVILSHIVGFVIGFLILPVGYFFHYLFSSDSVKHEIRTEIRELIKEIKNMF